MYCEVRGGYSVRFLRNILWSILIFIETENPRARQIGITVTQSLWILQQIRVDPMSIQRGVLRGIRRRKTSVREIGKNGLVPMLKLRQTSHYMYWRRQPRTAFTLLSAYFCVQSKRHAVYSQRGKINIRYRFPVTGFLLMKMCAPRKLRSLIARKSLASWTDIVYQNQFV